MNVLVADIKVDQNVTGVATSNERGSDLVDVQLLQESYILYRLQLNVETARMLRTALNTMKVLDV